MCPLGGVPYGTRFNPLRGNSALEQVITSVGNVGVNTRFNPLRGNSALEPLNENGVTLLSIAVLTPYGEIQL